MDEPRYTKWASFRGRMLMVGFGCIGRGLLPLLLRHLDLHPEQLSILTAEDSDRDFAARLGIVLTVQPLTRDNYRPLLEARLGEGDFLLNLSINVGSLDLIAWCQDRGVRYLDACLEPWSGGYFDASLTPSQRSNYALREAALALRGRHPGGPTAVLTHGVNPGLVSHFVKQALLNLAADLLPGSTPPRDRPAWGELAQRLGIRAIHIAERDSQLSARRKRQDEFVNTWSVDGFIGESCQPAELGWGSHERHWPRDAHRHAFGSGVAIWLARPGAATRVHSWTPLTGPYLGFLITHGESLSIADYLTLREGQQVCYRPTVHYAYLPCDDALLSLHELAGRNWRAQPKQHLLGADEVSSGLDELGVLLLGHARQAYWYGSRLTIEQARHLCPDNTATSLQTAAGVLAGVVWALTHENAGLIEPDEMDSREVLAVASPYLGDLVGIYGDWTPLKDRSPLFPEELDLDDPWQFRNVLVT